MLASVRRQGVRGDSLLKDSDNLLQRYRNLQARLQKQVDAQRALEGDLDTFNTQAQSTRTWITDLVQPLTSPLRDTKTEETKCKAQVREDRSTHAHQKTLTARGCISLLVARDKKSNAFIISRPSSAPDQRETQSWPT